MVAGARALFARARSPRGRAGDDHLRNGRAQHVRGRRASKTCPGPGKPLVARISHARGCVGHRRAARDNRSSQQQGRACFFKVDVMRAAQVWFTWQRRSPSVSSPVGSFRKMGRRQTRGSCGSWPSTRRFVHPVETRHIQPGEMSAFEPFCRGVAKFPKREAVRCCTPRLQCAEVIRGYAPGDASVLRLKAPLIRPINQ
jgi:hypothetical protein